MSGWNNQIMATLLLEVQPVLPLAAFVGAAFYLIDGATQENLELVQLLKG